MVSRRSALLRAASWYVRAGWPIVPGATPLDGRARVQVLFGGRSVSVACCCGQKDCFSPAAHPLGPDWRREHVTTEASARFWWDRAKAPVPNIVLCCGESFDVWSVPAAVGSYALGLLDGGTGTPGTPVAITPLARWHFFTAPEADHPALIPPHGMDVVRLSTGYFVPAPPSTRGPAGRDRWLIPPRHRLPTARTVAAALILATEYLTGGSPCGAGHQRCGSAASGELPIEEEPLTSPGPWTPPPDGAYLSGGV